MEETHHPFKLSRYFSIASLITIIAAAIVSGWTYRIIAIEDLKQQVENNNISLINAFSNIISPQILAFVSSDAPTLIKGSNRNINPLQIRTFHDSIQQLTQNTPVIKIKIYNTGNQTVYSSEQPEIGHTINTNHPANIALYAGKFVSDLDFQRRMFGIKGTKLDRWVLATFMPVRAVDDGDAQGVFEMDADITDLYDNIIDSQNKFTLIVAAVFGGVYLILFVIVRRADLIIRRQADERENYLQEIKRINKDLDQYARDLAQARDKAVEASSTKSQFLANMSHELRTPLNAVIGYSEMLAEDMQDQGQQSAVEDLTKIQSAGKHLLAIINDILDLSKIEAKSIELYMESFNIATIIHDISTTVAPLAEKSNNEFIIDCPDDIGEMHSDLTRVRQILFNLLGNACKFTENGVVSLRAKASGKGKRRKIVFSVEDTGIGLTQEQIETKIFQPFKQADASTTRSHGGTGLGLTISKRFAVMLGGDITVKSAPGRGSVFTVTLPAHSSADPVYQDQAIEIEPMPDPSRTRFSDYFDRAERRQKVSRVLIIDDDPAVRDLYQRHLRKEGFEVRVAKSGKEGLRTANSWRPDIITLDVMLPEMDGWEVLQALKNTPTLDKIPVVMITLLSEKEMGASLGASDYMTKPINWQQLGDVIKKWVRVP